MSGDVTVIPFLYEAAPVREERKTYMSCDDAKGKVGDGTDPGLWHAFFLPLVAVVILFGAVAVSMIPLLVALPLRATIPQKLTFLTCASLLILLFIAGSRFLKKSSPERLQGFRVFLILSAVFTAIQLVLSVASGWAWIGR